jgi:hypothetical protein
MTQHEKNPFITYYIHQLIDKKMNLEEMEQEKIAQLADSLYTRFESMLGRTIVESLPEERREAFEKELKGMNLKKDAVDLEKMSLLFQNINLEAIDFQAIMKDALQQLSDEFMKT